MPTPNKYPKEFRERAVRMVAELDEPGALRRVSEKLGVNRETVRYWVKNAPASRGGKRGLSDEEIGYVPPAEKEAMYYSENVSEKTLEIVG